MARHKAQASFFLTSHFLNQSAFRPLVQRICSQGHYVGPHGGRDVLSSAREQATAPGAIREQFEADFSSNLNGIGQWLQNRELPGYFLPPHERCNYELVQWAGSYFYVTVSATPGTLSSADVTGEAAPTFVSSQAIFDSIVLREQQDPHGLNGFILSFHLGSGPDRADKFHARLGQLLDVLAAKGYRFVAMDTMFDPQTAEEARKRKVVLQPEPVQVNEPSARRYGGTKRP